MALKFFNLSIVFTGCVMCASCSSLSILDFDSYGKPFSRTKSAVNNLDSREFRAGILFIAPAAFLLADVPISLVYDTVLLPIDLMCKSSEKEDDSLKKQETTIEK